MKAWIGCSGWQYNHWRVRFYPKEIPTYKWFEYYSRYFDTVEINSTFYHFPKASFAQKWYKNSKLNFKFTLKMNRAITHVKKFKNTENLVRNFYKVADNLKEKLGCILIQLPPFLKYSKSKLKDIFNQLDYEKKNVLEFRNESWFCEEVFDNLKENDLTYCIISHPKLPSIFKKTSEIVYVRFHGRESLYASNYKNEELKEWADKVKKLNPKEFWAYFNNDVNAYAIYNALYFKKLF